MLKTTIRISRNVADIMAEERSKLDLPLHWLLVKEHCACCGKQFKRMDGIAFRITISDEDKRIVDTRWACTPKHAVQYLMQYHPRLLEWQQVERYQVDERGI